MKPRTVPAQYLNEYGHCITIGQTMSGKTTLNRALAHWYQEHGINCVVLDPMRDPRWKHPKWREGFGSVMMFGGNDLEAFLAYVRNPDLCLQCALFLDESGSTIGRYIQSAEWLTTQSRHFGHVCHLLTQRAEMINKTMRSQCTTVFAFNVNAMDAKNYYLDWNEKALLEAPMLPKGHCIQATRFEKPRKWRMW